MPTIDVHGSTVEYYEAGSGKPLVLLHTLLADRTVYDRVVPELAAGRRVLTPNFPGYGASTGPIGGDIFAYGDRVVGFLDALGLDRVDLLGNGYGGFVAQAVALAHSARVDRLILVDTAPGFPEPAKVPLRGLQAKVAADGMAGVLDAAMLRMFPPAYIAAAPEVIAERRAALSRADPVLFANACGALVALDHGPRLAEIAQPTLVMVGLEDQTTPPELSRALAAGIVGARLIELPGVGHCPQVQAPQEFLDGVLGFLDDGGGQAEGPLFRPGHVGGIELKNRIVLAPMTRISADADGCATESMVAHYARYARGGFGLLITEGTYTDTLHSQCYAGQPGLATPEQAAAWAPVVAAVHGEGVPIFAQLMHAGALVLHNRYTNVSIAPSAVQPKGEQPARYCGKGPYSVPRAASSADITTAIAGFAQAARHAVEAGFDGIEIHGANGYLIDNFLTSYANQRTDRYGGSVANRVRLAVEVAEAVLAAVPSGFPVGIRISQTKVNDLEHEWEGGVEDARAIFGALGRIGLAYIHVSAHRGCGPVFGTGLSLAGLARRFSGLTVVANGRLEDVATAEMLVARGEVDLVSVAKAALADPDWPRKVASGTPPIPFEPAIFTPTARYEVEAAWRSGRQAD